jgi:hypothetical protein
MTAITLNLPEDIYQYLINRPGRDALVAAAIHDAMARNTEPTGASYEVGHVVLGVENLPHLFSARLQPLPFDEENSALSEGIRDVSFSLVPNSECDA